MREIKFRAIPIDEFDAVVGQDCGHAVEKTNAGKRTISK